MVENITINVAQDFSPFPVGRDERDSENFNGKKFRKEFLVPAMRDAIKNGAMVVVILEGLESFGSSFLEESFGGLVRVEGFSIKEITAHLKFEYQWSGYKIPENKIWDHIKKAKAEKV